MFAEFAKKNHACENIDFWRDVNEFRKKKLTGKDAMFWILKGDE